MSASVNLVEITVFWCGNPNAQICADSASLKCLHVCCCTMNNVHMSTQTHRNTNIHAHITETEMHTNAHVWHSAHIMQQAARTHHTHIAHRLQHTCNAQQTQTHMHSEQHTAHIMSLHWQQRHTHWDVQWLGQWVWAQHKQTHSNELACVQCGTPFIVAHLASV
jgi:hypothetical protein